MTNADRERLTRLEAEMDRMNAKLDDLIALRNKGAGAFWLASVLFGTTIVGFISMVHGWLKG